MQTSLVWQNGSQGEDGSVPVTNKLIEAQRCSHERLNEDGICRGCGQDCRGAHI